MKDVMIDFETLGNGSSKCICQVGAVYFDNVTGELGESFKANINAATHVKAGAKIDAETVYWWLKQSDEARASIVSGDLENITSVFLRLNTFLSNSKRIWSHATFDFVTLMETMKQLNITPSFSYRAGMDLRTLVYLAGVSTSDTVRTGVHHDALADAIHQVKYCVQSLNAIKTNKKLIAFANKLAE